MFTIFFLEGNFPFLWHTHLLEQCRGEGQGGIHPGRKLEALKRSLE